MADRKANAILDFELTCAQTADHLGKVLKE